MNHPDFEKQEFERIAGPDGSFITKASKSPTAIALQEASKNGGKPLVGYDFDDTLYPQYRPWTERINAVWRNDQADRVRTQLEAKPSLLAEAKLSDKARDYLTEFGYLPGTKTPSKSVEVPGWQASEKEAAANDPVRKEVSTFFHDKGLLPAKEDVAHPIDPKTWLGMGYKDLNALPVTPIATLTPNIYNGLTPMAGDKMVDSFVKVVKAGAEPVIVTAHPFVGRYAADMTPEETAKWQKETQQFPNEDYEKAKRDLLAGTLADYQKRHPDVVLPEAVRDLPNRFIFTHDKQDQGLAVLFDDSLGNVARMQDRTPPAKTKVVVIDSYANDSQAIAKENAKRATSGKAPLNVEFRAKDVNQGADIAIREILPKVDTQEKQPPAKGKLLAQALSEQTPTTAKQVSTQKATTLK